MRHVLTTRTAVTTTMTTTSRNEEKATRQRFAHFISAERIAWTSSPPCASVLVDCDSCGARRGKMRKKAPATQRSGHTATMRMLADYEPRSDAEELTEAEHEQVLDERGVLGVARVCRRRARV